MSRRAVIAAAALSLAACSVEGHGPPIDGPAGQPDGGSDGGSDGGAWSQPAVTGSPTHRDFGASVVADAANQRLILFGGAVSVPGGRSNLNDTWVLSSADGLGASPGQWTQLAPGGSLPPVRDNQGAAYDAAGNRLIIFGGCAGGCTPTLNDVWVLSNANGLGGAPVWTRLLPTGGPPAGRISFALAYDPSSNRLILFGGQNGGGTVAGNTYADVWVLTNANGQGGTPVWVPLAVSGTAPAEQYGPASAYDAATKTLYLLGGTSAAGVSSALHKLSGADGTGAAAPAWSDLAASGTSPPPLFANPATFDAQSGRVLLVAPAAAGGSLAEWVLRSPSTADWLRQAPSGGPPQGLAALGAVWFPASDRMTVVTNAAGGNVVWTFAGARGP